MDISEKYKSQVALLLRVLPLVAREKSFAMHGGTAINLFVREMPRLSVDVDLTYVPVEDRSTSFKNIVKALKRIQKSVEERIPEAHVTLHARRLKLQIYSMHEQIILEVNQANRGLIDPPKKMMLCKKAQDEFNAFCAIDVVPLPQLFGGKICAALDRQHPRDLFDIKYLLDNDGFTDEVKQGFILFLLSSNRPLHEMVNPHLIDQKHVMESQFEGMSYIPFTYEDFENTRNQLITIVQESLTSRDKNFLMDFKRITPDWSIYNFERFPAVQWKLHNLKRLRSENRSRYEEVLNKLENVLF